MPISDDIQVGDLHTAITDREIELLQGLHNGVVAQQHKIRQAAQALAQLDWYAEMVAPLCLV